VHAYVLEGGMQCILGEEHRAEGTFARAEKLAHKYEWHGTLADASKWVVHCCVAAGIDPPAFRMFGLPSGSAASDVAAAVQA
jgi:hypothetical protein